MECLPILQKFACFLWQCILDVKSLSRVCLFATPWTVAHQAPSSMEFSRQECWSGLPFPSAGDLPDPEIEPGSPALQADSLPLGCQGSLYVGSHLLSVITWSSREVTWNTRGEADHVTRNMTMRWSDSAPGRLVIPLHRPLMGLEPGAWTGSLKPSVLQPLVALEQEIIAVKGLQQFP